MKKSSDYRAMARETLDGCWSELAVVTLLIMLIASVCQTPATLGNVFQSISLKLMGGCGTFVMSILITMPLEYAFYNMFLSLVRREEKTESYVSELWHNFTSRWLKYVLVGLLESVILLLIFLPTLTIGFWILVLAYGMVPFVVQDNPEMSAIEALRTSRFMMRGHKWQLFKLSLSFIGWILLGIFTLCIGLLWVAPYINAATAHFYEDVKAEYEAKIANGEAV